MEEIVRRDLTYPLHVTTPYAVLAVAMAVPILLGLVLLSSAPPLIHS